MQRNTLNTRAQTRAGTAADYTGVIDWHINQLQPIEETKMFKNRFILVLGVLSVLLVSMAVSNPFPRASSTADQGSSDFYQRHPDWQWLASEQKAIIPLTGDAAFPDYHQRHPELSAPVEISIDTTDYFFRHPELRSK